MVEFNEERQAHSAMERYLEFDYHSCLDHLQQIKNNKKMRATDQKLLNNEALARFALTNDYDKLLQDLDDAESVITSVKREGGKANYFIVEFNKCVLHFLLKNYNRGAGIMEKLFACAENGLMNKFPWCTRPGFGSDELQVTMRISFQLIEFYIEIYRGHIFDAKVSIEFLNKVDRVFKYLEEKHAYGIAAQAFTAAAPGTIAGSTNGSSGSDISSSNNHSNSNNKMKTTANSNKQSNIKKVSSIKEPDEEDVIEFRYRLKLYRAKVKLLLSNAKGSKKDIKGALEIYQKELRKESDKELDNEISPKLTDHGFFPTYLQQGWWEMGGLAHNTTGLFFKAHLEFLRCNYPKAIKLLGECERSGIDLGLFYNSMGCVHFQRKLYSTAAFYFGKAHEQSGYLRSQRGRVLVSNQHEIMYNSGLSLLMKGNYDLAYKCFRSTLVRYGNRPRLWLRLAECCILKHKAIVNIGEEGLLRGAAGNGTCRKLLLTLGNSDIHSLATDNHTPSLTFAYRCLTNALYLLGIKEDVCDSFENITLKKSNLSANQKTGNHKKNTSKRNKNNSNNNSKTSGGTPSEIPGYQLSELLKQRICVQSMVYIGYISLCLKDPLECVEVSKKVLAMSDSICTTEQKYNVNLYCAEALCMLNRTTEAADTLSSSIKPIDLENLDAVESQCGLFVNLAIVTLMDQDGMDQAMAYATRAIQLQPRSIDCVKLILYLYLLRGERDKALAVIHSRNAAYSYKSE